jgi:hypothetical protein
MNKYLIAIIIILSAVFLHQCSRTQAFKTDLATKKELIDVLSDSVRYSTNKLGEITAEKRILRATVKDLEHQRDNLSRNQLKLLKEIKTANKSGDVKAGIQIQERVVFKNVQVIKNDTIVLVDSLNLDNEKTIILSDVKRGTIVTIKNSNPNFQTVNVDGLLIPDKKRWYNSRLFKSIIFGAGVATGVYITR